MEYFLFQLDFSLSYLIWMIKEDCVVIQEIQQGNYSAFEKLYNKYFQRIYAFVMIKSNGNIPLSQDVTSETFLKAFEKMDTFVCDETGSFSAWLYRIAYNSFIDAIKAKNPDMSVDDIQLVGEQIDYIDVIQKKSQAHLVMQFLETLGQDKKDIFLLRVWEDMNYTQISEIVGKSEQSCRQDFSRTLKKVVEKFQNIF